MGRTARVAVQSVAIPQAAKPSGSFDPVTIPHSRGSALSKHVLAQNPVWRAASIRFCPFPYHSSSSQLSMVAERRMLSAICQPPSGVLAGDSMGLSNR